MTDFDSSTRAGRAAQFVFDAESCAANRDWCSADASFCKAMELDDSPASRIAYGVCLATQERYFEAITTFTPILDGVNRSAIGIVCHNLAAIYRDVGDFDLARRFQWRATLLQDDSGEEDLLGMANDAFASQHSEVAAALIATATEINADRLEDGIDGELVATAGLIEAALESPESGLMTLFTAYRHHQSVRDFRGMGLDLVNMSVLFGEANRPRAERACLVRAIRCFENAPAPHSCQRAQQQLRQLDLASNVRSFDARRN